MKKTILILLLVWISGNMRAQPDLFVFKKGNRTKMIFSTGSYIAFQVESRAWIAGTITKVQHDSFFLKPIELIYRSMSIDTIATEIVPFALTDVFALPKEGVLVDFRDNQFQIDMGGGHLHWYWIKSGWIFEILGTGYIALDAVNGLIQNDFTFSLSRYGPTAAMIALGVILHHPYRLTYRIGKRYSIESIRVVK